MGGKSGEGSAVQRGCDLGDDANAGGRQSHHRDDANELCIRDARAVSQRP